MAECKALTRSAVKGLSSGIKCTTINEWIVTARSHSLVMFYMCQWYNTVHSGLNPLKGKGVNWLHFAIPV